MKPYYQDDSVTLYHGDCLEVMPKLAVKSVDMVLSDPPYGTTKNKWDSVIDLSFMWASYDKVCKDAAPVVLTAQTPFDKTLGASNLAHLRYEWIWEKSQATGHLNAKRAPMKAHENILVFYKSLPTYNPQKTTGHERKISTAAHKRNSNFSGSYGSHQHADYDSTERYPRSVLKFPSDRQKSKLHPTQKPVALLEYLVVTYTNPGDLVLDNCAGSGSTLVAATTMGRASIGIEREEKYCELIAQRLDKGDLELIGAAKNAPDLHQMILGGVA